MIRVAAAVALAFVIFAAGWMVKGWQVDSRDLAVAQAAKAIAENAVARESDIAALVEEKLSGLKANQTVIDRGIIREVQNPVYRNVCVSDHAISLLNAAARGEAPVDPAEPVGEVPSITLDLD